MFRRLINRNLIAMSIPVLVIEFLLVIITLNLSMMDEYTVYEIEDREADYAFMEGKYNVSMTIPENLSPAGFDYESQDDISGAFYYDFQGDSIRIYVLSDEKVNRLKSGISTIDILARLEKNEKVSAYIEKEYSDWAGLEDDSAKGFVNPVIINEITYPASRIKALRLGKFLSVIIIGVTILYIILAFLYPSFNLSFSNKGTGLSRHKLIYTLDDELRENLLEQDGNVFKTENYIVTYYISHTDIEKRNESNIEKDDS